MVRSGEKKVGQLVLIKDNMHPLHWRLGRITRRWTRQLHPGPDGVTRVATLDTTSGNLTHPAVKLCPLPIFRRDSFKVCGDVQARP